VWPCDGAGDAIAECGLGYLVDRAREVDEECSDRWSRSADAEVWWLGAV
jgi:hypothetical protein